MSALRFLDFFAGVGMVELALEPEWECVWANDVDPKKAAIYRANHVPERFHLGDIARVQVDDLPAGVEMAWASFPCQDLSLAGWQRGMTAERSGTFWEFYRIMSQLMVQNRRPSMIVLENVVGLLNGSNFISLCEALDSLNMQFGALVIDAVRFLPQSRPRVFVVAVDREVDCRPWTASAPSENWSPSVLIRAHGQLPKHLLRQWRWWSLSAPTTPIASVESIIEDVPRGVVWHTEAETTRLLNMMSPPHLRKIEQNLARQGRTVGFLYKRTRGGQQRAEVRFDGIAGCLRTPTGGSSRQTLVLIEDGAVRTRLISPKEAARLMGVENGFWLPDSYNDAYHAMGDGVAVPAVRWLSQHLLLPLAQACTHQDGNRKPKPVGRRSLVAQLALAEETAAWR